MNIAAAITIASSLLCLYAFVLCSRLSRAPGWQDQGWFALIALSGSAFVALDIINSIAASDGAVLSFGRFQVFVGGINSAAWLIYTQRTLNGPAVSLASKVCAAVLIGIGCSALSPGLFTDQKVLEFYSSLLHVTYRVPAFTDYGNGVIALLTLVLLVSAARFGRAWWRKVPGARAHFLGLTALTLCVINDFLMSLDVLKTPLLIDVGYTIAICGSALALTGRFVQDARALEAFSAGLERTVETRTRELFGAHEELHRAEKLAGVGQLAAGLAHEINNPAGVIKSNLDYLAGALGTDEPLDELRAIVNESAVAIDRVARIVAELSFAAQPITPSQSLAVGVDLAKIATESEQLARKQCPGAGEFALDVPQGLELNGHAPFLTKLFTHLIANALAAQVPGRPLKIRLWARQAGARVNVVLEDNGVGIAPEALRRLYEPFFTTKPVGVGLGLGLVVCRGLVRSMGGKLDLTSEVDVGTRVLLELAASTDEPRSSLPARIDVGRGFA